MSQLKEKGEEGSIISTGAFSIPILRRSILVTLFRRESGVVSEKGEKGHGREKKGRGTALLFPI